MPISDIILLSIVVLAFDAFAVGLIWGDYQTREIARASRERPLTSGRVVPIKQEIRADTAVPAASPRGKVSIPP